MLPGTVSRATLWKLLRDGVERIWAFPSAHIPSWTELNWTVTCDTSPDPVWWQCRGLSAVDPWSATRPVTSRPRTCSQSPTPGVPRYACAPECFWWHNNKTRSSETTNIGSTVILLIKSVTRERKACSYICILRYATVAKTYVDEHLNIMLLLMLTHDSLSCLR